MAGRRDTDTHTVDIAGASAYIPYDDSDTPHIVHTRWGDVDMMDRAGKKPRRRDGLAPPMAIEQGTTPDARRADIARIVQNVRFWAKSPPPRTDDEIAERIDAFFTRCAETGEIPTVEKLAICMGIGIDTLGIWRYGRGCSTICAGYVQKALDIVASCDAELALEGKINPVCYIFRAKAIFGLHEDNVITIRHEDSGMSIDALRRLYADTPAELPDSMEIPEV